MEILTLCLLGLICGYWCYNIAIYSHSKYPWGWAIIGFCLSLIGVIITGMMLSKDIDEHNN